MSAAGAVARSSPWSATTVRPGWRGLFVGEQLVVQIVEVIEFVEFEGRVEAFVLEALVAKLSA